MTSHRTPKLRGVGGCYKMLPPQLDPVPAVQNAELTRVYPLFTPEKDVKAEILAIRAGLKSRGMTINETGMDEEEVDRQIARDNDRADELGLVLDSDPRKTTPKGLLAGGPENGGEDGGEGAPPKPPAKPPAKKRTRKESGK